MLYTMIQLSFETCQQQQKTHKMLSIENDQAEIFQTWRTP